MITIIDYGLGNIRAFLNVYRRLNMDVKIATNAQELLGASKVILPGVGSESVREADSTESASMIIAASLLLGLGPG